MPNLSRRTFGILLASSALVPLAAPAAASGPKADLWPRWESHDPNSTIVVDHAPWDSFLAKYVEDNPNGLNTVDYAGVADADKKTLDDYVAALAGTEVSKLNRAEQEAFWINLYNSLTIQVVLDHMPVESIRDISISPGFFAAIFGGPWGKKLLEVEGEELSLDDIEHRILRPIWNDPRIHYAVNCASVGCPDLMARAFRPATMDADLTANAKAYVNSPRGVMVKESGGIVVSSIYEWFQADFDNSEKGVIAHLKLYAADQLKAHLDKVTGIDDYEYDWSLNAPGAGS